MKNRGICTACAVLLCISLAGCGNKQGASSDLAKGPYTDGVYEARLPEYEYGWKEYGKITVADGYITDVEFDALNEAGQKKTADTAYRDNMAAGNTANGFPATYPEKAYGELIASFRAKEYDAEKIDGVAGATTSSENFKKIMSQLMDFVKTGQPGVMTLRQYKDGTYEVEMPEYDNGWKDYVRVTVKEGEVSAIEFDARNEKGELKTANESYKNNMISGNAANNLPQTYPAEYAQKLIDNYAAAGSTDEMEMVAGATTSSKNFKKLLKHALLNAKNGDTALSVAPIYEDGKYRAQMKKSDQGWTEFVEVHIQNNAITQITFDAFDADGAYKSKNTAYQEQMQAAGSKTYPAQFYPAIIQEFIDKKYLPDDMDKIAGATNSTQNFKKLVAAALEKALNGDSATADVEG